MKSNPILAFFPILASLILASLACTVQAAQPLPVSPVAGGTDTATTQPTATRTQKVPTATEEIGIVNVLANVWTRDRVSNVRVGSLAIGDSVRAECSGSWCLIANTDLKFWRGCSDNNPANIGCKAEE